MKKETKSVAKKSNTVAANKKTAPAKKAPSTKTNNKTTAAAKKPVAKAPNKTAATAKSQTPTKAPKVTASKAKQPAKTTGKSSCKQKNSATKVVSTRQTKAVSTKAAATKSAVSTRPNVKRSDLVTVEIRIHNDAKGGHPHIMVDSVDDKNVSVGTTHDKYKGKGHANAPLDMDPLGSKDKVYMHKQGTVDRKSQYSPTSQSGKMTVKDSEKAKTIGARAKQKYLQQQKKNK